MNNLICNLHLDFRMYEWGSLVGCKYRVPREYALKILNWKGWELHLYCQSLPYVTQLSQPSTGTWARHLKPSFLDLSNLESLTCPPSFSTDVIHLQDYPANFFPAIQSYCSRLSVNWSGRVNTPILLIFVSRRSHSINEWIHILCISTQNWTIDPS